MAFLRRRALARTVGVGADGRVIAPLLALVGTAIVLTGVLAYLGSARQDALQKESEERAIAQSQEALVRGLSGHVRDYAYWNDAVRFLVLALDEAWADENVGPYIASAFGHELTLVVDGGDRVVYGHVDGERDTAGAAAVLRGGLAEIAAAARAKPGEPPEAVAGVMAGADGIYAVAAAQLVVDHAADLAQPAGPRSVLVFADRLDRGYLARLAADYGVQPLRLSDEPPGEGLAAVRLADVGGRSPRWLTWEPHRPGAAQLAWLLPLLAAAMAVFGGLAVLVLRSIRLATAVIRESEARFKDIAEAASDWFWETDAGMRLTYLSDSCVRATGHEAAGALGRELHDVFPLAAEPGHERRQAATLAAQAPFRGVLCRVRAGGQDRVLRLAGKPVFNAWGELRGYRGTASDITAERAALEQARYRAEHDELTGLPNRLLLRDRLQEALARTRRHGGHAALLCIDVDRLKEVNDALGHAAGDALLVAYAERLRGCLGESDVLARLVADEFAILLGEVAEPAAVRQLCGRILGDLAAPVTIEGQEIQVTASIGGVFLATGGGTPARLLQNADIALHRAKAAGRGGSCFFEAGMDEALRRRKALEVDLRAAFAGGRLEVHYQPQIDAGDTRLVGVEGLLRWTHPERGPVSPADFVPIAEETGLIVPIGEWVLRTACRDAVRWPGVRVSINVSPVQFKQRDLVATVAEALADSGLDPGRLELEITEGVLLDQTAHAVETLRQLKKLGVSVAMDDFGTGYSSLSYLHKFPFDKIKIDRAFVRGLAGEGDSRAIVRAIINLGQSLNMRTCAEGVETEAQLEHLRAEGCEEMQGFLFGGPGTAASVDAMLAANGRAATADQRGAASPAAPAASPATASKAGPNRACALTVSSVAPRSR